jgi:hypothetical protein
MSFGRSCVLIRNGFITILVIVAVEKKIVKAVIGTCGRAVRFLNLAV